MHLPESQARHRLSHSGSGPQGLDEADEVAQVARGCNDLGLGHNVQARTVDVRPLAWDLHPAAVPVLDDDFLLSVSSHLELLSEEWVVRASHPHPGAGGEGFGVVGVVRSL